MESLVTRCLVHLVPRNVRRYDSDSSSSSEDEQQRRQSTVETDDESDGETCAARRKRMSSLKARSEALKAKELASTSKKGNKERRILKYVKYNVIFVLNHTMYFLCLCSTAADKPKKTPTRARKSATKRAASNNEERGSSGPAAAPTAAGPADSGHVQPPSGSLAPPLDSGATPPDAGASPPEPGNGAPFHEITVERNTAGGLAVSTRRDAPVGVPESAMEGVRSLLRSHRNDVSVNDEEDELLKSSDDERIVRSPSSSGLLKSHAASIVNNSSGPDTLTKDARIARDKNLTIGREQTEPLNLSVSTSDKANQDSDYLASSDFRRLVHAVSQNLTNKSLPLTEQRSAPPESLSSNGVRRIYRLTPTMRWDLWYDYLKSELTAKDLWQYLHTDNVPGISAQEMERRKLAIRDIIINRVDDHFHQRVVSISDPSQIIKELELYKKREINTTSFIIRKQLNNLRYNPRINTAAGFIDRFDNLIRSYESMDDRHDLSEEEKNDAFYNAVKAGLPSLIEQNFNYKMLSNKNMSREQIKNYMLQREVSCSLPKLDGRRAPEARTALTSSTNIRTITRQPTIILKRLHSKPRSFRAQPNIVAPSARLASSRPRTRTHPKKRMRKATPSTRCYKCQGLGHFAATCIKNRVMSGTCGNCGLRGHTKENCRKPQRELKSSTQKARQQTSSRPSGRPKFMSGAPVTRTGVYRPTARMAWANVNLDTIPLPFEYNQGPMYTVPPVEP